MLIFISVCRSEGAGPDHSGALHHTHVHWRILWVYSGQYHPRYEEKKQKQKTCLGFTWFVMMLIITIIIIVFLRHRQRAGNKQLAGKGAGRLQKNVRQVVLRHPVLQRYL